MAIKTRYYLYCTEAYTGHLEIVSSLVIDRYSDIRSVQSNQYFLLNATSS